MTDIETLRTRLVSGLLIDERSGRFRDAIELPARDTHRDPLLMLQALLDVLPTTPTLLVGWSEVDGADEVLDWLGPPLGRVTLSPGTEMDWHLWWLDWSGLREIASRMLTIPHILAPAKPSWILDAPPALKEWFLFVEPNSVTQVWKQ